MKTIIAHPRSLLPGLPSPLRHALACVAAVLLLLPVPPRLHGQDSFAPAFNGPVYSFVPEPGGTVMLGGAFYWTENENTALVRLDHQGNTHWSFSPLIPSGQAQAVALLPDGTVLAGGQLSALFVEPGQPILHSFMRFSATGLLLPTFQIQHYVPVYCLAPQADGKVLIGGSFTALDGVPRTMLARYLPTGALDSTFAPAANDLVFTIAVQPDGQVLAGGMFTSLGGQPRNRLGRLSSTGVLDPGFNPNANGAVGCLLVQPDGKILVGGSFTTLGGLSHVGLGRLNPDGSPDSSFNLNANASVQTMALQANGKILLGGEFTAIGGQARSRLARLNSDGTLDTSFTTGANNVVYSLALQEDGRVLVGGDFTVLGGQSRTRAGRLANSDAPSQSVTFDGATLTWQRGGSLTEVWRTEAEAWSGTGWTNIGPGTRIAGGWQWTGLAFPTDQRLRLRGHAKGGRFCASTWLPQTYAGPLALTQSPTNRTNLAATSAAFTASFIGSEPIAYRWQRDGLPLADNANVSGAATPALTLASVLGGDAGAYALVASNAFGSLTSAVATLTVVEPVITTQPTNVALLVDGNASFTVSALGTAPLLYQWWKDGSPVNAATNSTLNFNPVQVADAGMYSAVVSSDFGSATSGVAVLTVWEPARIAVPPTSQSNYFGAPVTLNVTAAGTAPLSHQWRKDGAVIAGATSSTLAFPGLAHADVASYDVVVTNLYGSATSAPVAVVVLDPYFLTQPTSVLRNVGESVTFSASAAGLVPLQYLWRRSGVPISGATASSLTLTNLQASDAANYDLVAFNPFGSATSSVAVLTVNIVVADSFNPGANNSVVTLIPMPDGRFLAGGNFTTLAGVTRSRLGRLTADGMLDATFLPALNNAVKCMALQRDGRVLFGGDFTTLNAQPRNRLARLNENGTVDVDFNPDVNGTVNCILLQPDGTTLIGGSFSAVNGQTRTNLARLNSDGALDTNFTAGANGVIYSIARQLDGTILVGGNFTWLAGVPRSSLGRLDGSGVPDPLFNPGVSGQIETLALQPDGKILVGGSFGQLGGQSRANLGRLKPDGSLDADFRADTDGAVKTMALLTDGSVVLGGVFRNVAGFQRSYLARLGMAGAVDTQFAAGTDAAVSSLALMADGRLLVGGQFTTLTGQSRRYLGRLPGAGPATQEVTFDGTTLTWLRSGSGPEITLALAEAWNNSSWASLGLGSRTGGGWTWTVPPLPPGTTLRVWGQAAGGGYQGSGWWAEQSRGLPRVIEPGQTLARNAGGSVSLAVRPVGSPPFGYQWLHNLIPLSDEDNVAGATSSNLVLSVLGCAASGNYALVVTNAYGSVTSQVALLTVRDPVIAAQPQSTAVDWGSNATFTVTVAGPPAHNYQWRKAGGAVPGATSPALTVTNVQPTDAVGYDVVISGGCGATTSIVVYLNQELARATPGEVLGLAPLADGRVLAAGYLHYVGGLSRSAFVRYQPEGMADPSFNVGADANGYCLAVQPDGRVLVGGAFTSTGGQNRNRLFRLTADGAVDPNFNPNLDGEVLCLALQADGKILVGGVFTRVGGVARNRIARLNPDGTVDSGFNPGANGAVHSLAVQPDGKIIAGGVFGTLGGALRSYLGRVFSSGAIDTTFNPQPNDLVNAVAVQSDGLILIGGRFLRVKGDLSYGIARLYPNGTLDSGFNPHATWDYGGRVNSVVVQTDGRILVGGFFGTLANQNRNSIGRLNPDGTIDDTWNPGATSFVNGLAIQADGRILVGGLFGTLGGRARVNIGRLDNTDVATSSLVVGSDTVTWLRGGTGPEVWRTTFDTWNGFGWTNLGAGTRIAGGWQLGGLSLPANATVRAQGFAIGGDDNCSSYIVEEGFGPPVVSIAPVNRTNFVGTAASLSAWVVGSGPVRYRWRKGGVELADGGNLSGAGTPNLSLANVQPSDSGWYSVVATNALGSVTTADVYLSVVPLQLTASGPGLGWTTNRQFAFQLSGGGAWPVSVEASTNLRDWQGLTTLWVGPESAVLTDTAATNYPVRAFRARPVP